MSYDPETRLILLSLSSKKNDEIVHSLRALSSQKIDWSYILSFSRHNGIAPLLFHNLNRYAVAESMPEGIRQTFKKIYHSVGFQNALYLEELQHLLHIFEQAGIRTVILKGAAILEDVFRNIALRQMADLDVLVQEEDLDIVGLKLSESGYVPNEHEHTKEWYREQHHHLAPYYHPDRKIAVEIHHHIIPPENHFGIEIEKLWERAQPIHIGNIRTFTLSPEDLIIHLCLHLAYCGGFIGGLRSLADIDQAIRYYGDRMDWNLLVKESCKHYCINFVYYPLYLSKDLLNTEIDDNIAKSLKQHSKLNARDISLLNLMTKNILLKNEASSILPKGYLSIFCKQVLEDTPIYEKLRYLIDRVVRKPVPEIKDSTRSSESDQPDFPSVRRIARIFSSNSCHLAKAVFHKRLIRRKHN